MLDIDNITNTDLFQEINEEFPEFLESFLAKGWTEPAGYDDEFKETTYRLTIAGNEECLKRINEQGEFPKDRETLFLIAASKIERGEVGQWIGDAILHRLGL